MFNICLVFALSFAFTTVNICLTWTKNQSFKILFSILSMKIKLLSTSANSNNTVQYKK